MARDGVEPSTFRFSDPPPLGSHILKPLVFNGFTCPMLGSHSLWQLALALPNLRMLHAPEVQRQIQRLKHFGLDNSEDIGINVRSSHHMNVIMHSGAERSFVYVVRPDSGGED